MMPQLDGWTAAIICASTGAAAAATRAPALPVGQCRQNSFPSGSRMT